MKKIPILIMTLITIAFLTSCTRAPKDSGDDGDLITFMDGDEIIGTDSLLHYSLPYVYKRGYRITGWYLDKQLTESFYSSSDNYPVTVYAKLDPLNVAFYSDSEKMTTVKYVDGNLTMPTKPVKTDKAFAGWYRDKAFTEPFTSYERSKSDINAYANFIDVTSMNIASVSEELNYSFYGNTNSKVEILKAKNVVFDSDVTINNDLIVSSDLTIINFGNLVVNNIIANSNLTIINYGSITATSITAKNINYSGNILNINSPENGIVADDLLINSGRINITSNLDGIKADKVEIQFGSFVINSNKNGIAANNVLIECSEKMTISATESGIIAEEYLVINSTHLEITKAKNGLVGKLSLIIGRQRTTTIIMIDIKESEIGLAAGSLYGYTGKININSKIDGVNINRGCDLSSDIKFSPGGFSEFPEDEEIISEGNDYIALFSGLDLTINSQMDGIDANTFLTVEGGYYAINCQNNEGQCIDYLSNFAYSGGAILAFGNTETLKLPTSSVYLLFVPTRIITAGEEIVVIRKYQESEIFRYTIKNDISGFVYICFNYINANDSYNVLVGNEVVGYSIAVWKK